jgi:hypothetical protein
MTMTLPFVEVIRYGTLRRADLQIAQAAFG